MVTRREGGVGVFPENDGNKIYQRPKNKRKVNTSVGMPWPRICPRLGKRRRSGPIVSGFGCTPLSQTLPYSCSLVLRRQAKGWAEGTTTSYDKTISINMRGADVEEVTLQEAFVASEEQKREACSKTWESAGEGGGRGRVPTEDAER